MQILNFADKQKLAIKFLLLSGMLHGSCYAASSVSLTTSSSELQPTATQPLIKCPVFKINNDQAYVQGSPSGNTMNFSTDCSVINTTVEDGAIGNALGVIGGDFHPSCPTDYPFTGGMFERFGGALPVGAGATMILTCCKTPQPVITMKSDSTTWKAVCD